MNEIFTYILDPIQRDIFSENTTVLEKRVHRPLERVEVILLALHIGLMVGYIRYWVQGYPVFFDYGDYSSWAAGNFQHFFYAYWALPIFKFLNALPGVISVALWGVMNILSLFMGTRIFGNRVGIVFTTYQTFYIVYYGQIIGVIIGGLALLWLGLRKENYLVGGIGLVIAGIKFHIGLPVALLLIFLNDTSWDEILKIAAIPTLVGLVSVIADPSWPLRLIRGIGENPPNRMGSITLWQWVGAFSMFLWVPIVLLPMTKMERLMASLSALSLSLPYFQQTDLLTMFVFPLGPISWLGNLGFFFIFGKWAIFKGLVVIPIYVYFVLIGSCLLKFVRDRQ